MGISRYDPRYKGVLVLDKRGVPTTRRIRKDNLKEYQPAGRTGRGRQFYAKRDAHQRGAALRAAAGRERRPGTPLVLVEIHAKNQETGKGAKNVLDAEAWIRATLAASEIPAFSDFVARVVTDFPGIPSVTVIIGVTSQVPAPAGAKRGISGVTVSFRGREYEDAATALKDRLDSWIDSHEPDEPVTSGGYDAGAVAQIREIEAAKFDAKAGRWRGPRGYFVMAPEFVEGF